MIDVVQVVELASVPGDAPIDTIDRIMRKAQSEFDVDVRTAKAVDDANSPQDEGAAD